MAGMIDRTLKEAANEANPNKLGPIFQNRAGRLMSSSLRYARGTVAGHRLVLPDEAKAAALHACTIIAAGAGTGPAVLVSERATIATTQAQIAPNGDVRFAAADAVTEAEVWYQAYEADPVTMDVIVDPATGVGLLQPWQAARLISATALTGTVTGAAAVGARSSAQPSGTGVVNLALTGASVIFLIADAVTSARVTFIPRPGFGPAADTVAGECQETVTF